jgi:shikimate kinase/3-dehydroquinate synthase
MNLSSLFLYGPSGSGKSTVGRLLAQNLGLPFYDLDMEIENSTGMSIAEIFVSGGESSFRRREKAELNKILKHSAGVVALGGGSLLDAENRNLVESHGQVLLLHAPASTLAGRLSVDSNQRPLLLGDQTARLAELLSRRAEHYDSFILKLDTTSLAPEQAVWEAQVRLGVFHVKGMSASYKRKPDGYDVRVQPGGLDCLGEELSRKQFNNPVVIVSDDRVGPLYIQRVESSLRKAGFPIHSMIIPAGEKYKTISTVISLWESFLSAKLERSSTVIALGGGVVSDLTGFAAATYLRGVHWLVLPTTLLAMVDASLGGKTGADLPEGKNLIGAFYPPGLVVADPETLATLPALELHSGLGEVVKHGIIGDPCLFDQCSRLNVDMPENDGSRLFTDLVRRAIAVKIKIIEQDPYEQGIRASLNLGHTVGHAVEHISGYHLHHGEAIAIGIAIEARIAEEIGLAEPGLAERITSVIKHLGLPTDIPTGMDPETIIRIMGVDKKRAGGIVRFALPANIGDVRVGIDVGDLRRLHALGFGVKRAES